MVKFDKEVSWYLTEVKKYKPFTKEEQIEYFKKYQNGENVLDILFKRNSRLVIKECKKYFDAITNTNLTKMDLIQEGNMALLKAIETYDLSYETAFSTWANQYIQNALKYILITQLSPIKIDYQFHIIMNNYLKAFDNLCKDLEREPTVNEMSEILGLKKEKIYQIKIVLKRKEKISLNDCLLENGEKIFYDIEDNNDLLTVDNIFLKQYLFDILNKINLTENEKKVLIDRYGLIDGRKKTMQELADKLGLCKNRILQLETHALKKIRKSPYIYEIALTMDNYKENLRRIGKTDMQIQLNLEKIKKL